MALDDEQLDQEASEIGVDTETPEEDMVEAEAPTDEPADESFVYDEDSLNLAMDFDAHPDEGG